MKRASVLSVIVVALVVLVAIVGASKAIRGTSTVYIRHTNETVPCYYLVNSSGYHLWAMDSNGTIWHQIAKYRIGTKNFFTGVPDELTSDWGYWPISSSGQPWEDMGVEGQFMYIKTVVADSMPDW